MRKRLPVVLVLLVTAILSGYMLLEFLKKAGFKDAFDFDLNEDIDEEAF